MRDEEQISPDFPYKSKFIEVLDSEMHYIEDGSGEPILFLHETRADLQNQAVGWLGKGCSSIGGGTVVQFP